MNCEHIDITESDQIFKNRVKHIRLDCKSCNTFTGLLYPRNISSSMSLLSQAAQYTVFIF